MAPIPNHDPVSTDGFLTAMFLDLIMFLFFGCIRYVYVVMLDLTLSMSKLIALYTLYRRIRSYSLKWQICVFVFIIFVVILLKFLYGFLLIMSLVWKCISLSIA